MTRKSSGHWWWVTRWLDSSISQCQIICHHFCKYGSSASSHTQGGKAYFYGYVDGCIAAQINYLLHISTAESEALPPLKTNIALVCQFNSAEAESVLESSELSYWELSDDEPCPSSISLIPFPYIVALKHSPLWLENWKTHYLPYPPQGLTHVHRVMAEGTSYL